MTKERDLEQEERRAKRALRRQKQREANVGRAQKMHNARMAAADLSYPTPNLPAINVGCSGWFYWHWRGQFYPTDMPTTNWFSHYSKNFKTVELNAPFYSWPTLANVATWQRQIGRKKFIYTVKVCELITHIKGFIDTETLVQDFSYIADLLQSHMGCFLYQLPPSFHYTPERLRNIVMQLDSKRRNVVEFRHASWWNEEVYAAFRQAGIIFCSCSGPQLPEELISTTDEVYIRFHGREKWYWYDYSDDELMAWAEKIALSNAKRIWAYFNNDREGHAINNAKNFIKILKKLQKNS
ncbi:Protein of uncharacterised function DUF72 [Legionella beliardensis]|uniref:Protein of uncharacterized function DUF72 n=1 Tax=Legionella beliardensis TaxID=91822 RepID=A0A378I295_9GAMM|nr:DUF72 domain-containing protein [Legionella beliardensis]STX29299.1 Protein of uncharacterised function DUF72 [Legionella beliardensis]